MASAELVWQIVKDNSCFLQKRKVPGRSQMGKMGPHFTTEPNNLAGINSWKYSGLANTKSVGIDAAAGGGVAFVTKTSKAKKIRKVRASRPARRARPPARPPAATQWPLSPSRRCVAAVEAVQQAGAQRRLPSGGPGDQQRGEGQLLPPRPRERCAARQPRPPNPSPRPRRRRRPARPSPLPPPPCRLGSGRAAGGPGADEGRGTGPRHPGADSQRPPRARDPRSDPPRARAASSRVIRFTAPRRRARHGSRCTRRRSAARPRKQLHFTVLEAAAGAAGSATEFPAAAGVESAARRFLQAPNCIPQTKRVRRTGPAPGAVAPLL